MYTHSSSSLTFLQSDSESAYLRSGSCREAVSRPRGWRQSNRRLCEQVPISPLNGPDPLEVETSDGTPRRRLSLTSIVDPVTQSPTGVLSSSGTYPTRADGPTGQGCLTDFRLVRSRSPPVYPSRRCPPQTKTPFIRPLFLGHTKLYLRVRISLSRTWPWT